MILIRSYFEKNENKEQRLLVEQFIESDYSGVIIEYKRVSRGFILCLTKETIRLGIEGISLTDQVSKGDSLSKISGNPNFYLYKDLDGDDFYEKIIIIESGY